jgi:hypothetical protein
MSRATKILSVLSVGILLTGCTVTTKSEEIGLDELALTQVNYGCVEFRKSDFAKAAQYFGKAARTNPQYIPIVEHLNVLINPWTNQGNALIKTQLFMNIYCAEE